MRAFRVLCVSGGGRCYPFNRAVNEILRVLTLYSYHWVLSYIVWGNLFGVPDLLVSVPKAETARTSPQS
jgi:hypothetical protein